MNKFLFIATLALSAGTVFAEPPSSSYGAPPQQEYGVPQQQVFGGYGDGPSTSTSTGQIHRHVYIHVAPDDATDSQSKVIRVPGGQDKHVNIIFVKAPSSSSAANTEVILPEPEQQKTLVYVLLKKGDSSNDVKIRGPAPTKPSKPQVYFIRYKDEQQQQTGGYGSPAPAPIYNAPTSYGAPAAQPLSSYGAPQAG